MRRIVFYFRKRRKVVRRRRDPARAGYLKYKADALTLAQMKVEQWSKVYGLEYNRVSVKNHTSRWGSCSKKKNLNFNYRIVHLPLRLVDYLVVHELCHLQEFNHSPKFWALVAQAVPNAKELRKELKLLELKPS